MRPHRSDCCRNTRYFKKALCPKEVLRQSPFHSAGATLLRDAEAFMYLQHKCPYGGKHLSLKTRPALRSNPACTAGWPQEHCTAQRATGKNRARRALLQNAYEKTAGNSPGQSQLAYDARGPHEAAPASPEGLKNRRTVAKQVAPAKTDSLGMSEKLRKTPATTLPAFLLTPSKKRFCGRRLSRNS